MRTGRHFIDHLRSLAASLLTLTRGLTSRGFARVACDAGSEVVELGAVAHPHQRPERSGRTCRNPRQRQSARAEPLHTECDQLGWRGAVVMAARNTVNSASDARGHFDVRL